MKYHPRKKKKSYDFHVTQRSVERYGVAFTKATISSFVSQIQGGKATFISRSSNRVTVWYVIHPDTQEQIKVVYDKIRKAIVTILPKDGT